MRRTSRTTLQWLYRVGVGAVSALLVALQQYLGDVDVTEAGVWSVIAGVVVTALTWLIGKLVGKLPAKPGP